MRFETWKFILSAEVEFVEQHEEVAAAPETDAVGEAVVVVVVVVVVAVVLGTEEEGNNMT